MNVFQRNFLGLNLTPGQRAFIKFAKGAAVTALAAGLAAGAQFLLLPTVNWHAVFLFGGGTVAASFAFALDKYWTAQGDAPLGTVAGEVGTIIGQKTGVNDVKQGVA